jgi:hypothetical protein
MSLGNSCYNQAVVALRQHAYLSRLAGSPHESSSGVQNVPKGALSGPRGYVAAACEHSYMHEITLSYNAVRYMVNSQPLSDPMSLHKAAVGE